MNKQQKDENRAKLREKLRSKLRNKLGEKQINRSSKKCKEKILDKSMSTMGLDYKKLKEDLEAIKKQGGLTLNMKN